MFKKEVNQILVISGVLMLTLSTLESCMTFKGRHTPVIVTDLVCGMKVDKAEAYNWKYKDVKYYFCSYNCKQTFKMKPQQVLDKCAEKQ